MAPPGYWSYRSSITAGKVDHTLIVQELLAALVGFTGDVFVDTSVSRDPTKIADPSEVCIRLADDIHWISESQRQILNDLAKLGFHYQELRRFVESEDSVQLDSGSVYKSSIVTAISELLSVYHSAVLQLQQQMLQQPTPFLPTLQAQLGDFQLLMRHVHDLLHELQSVSGVQAMTGSAMLRTLWAGVTCGVPVLQSVRLRLLWHCHRVLYRQITAWIVHGQLLDHHNEFFIQRATPQTESRTQPVLSSNATDVAYHEWHDGFKVEVAALPHFISLEVADALMFIGKAIRVLRQPAGNLQHHHELLSKEDTLAFSEAMTQLAAQPVFNRSMFERTVETIRTKVAGLLWHLVVVHADLMSHLAAMKDFFLLARGDFFHCFLDEASSVMSAPPRPATADHDINIPFQQAALKTGTQNHRLFNLVKIRHSMEEVKVQYSSNTNTYIEVPSFDPAWDNLFLDYHVEWPLGLLITKPVLDRYNALFRFLLRLKRVQLRLENAWCDLCRMYGPRSSRHMPAEVRRLFQLRQHMAHFITNLQIYIQVDVIESNYAALEARVAGAADFVEAERAHTRYLNALLTECLLTSKNLCKQIGSVFGHVQDFCQVVSTAKATGSLDSQRIDLIAQHFFLKVNTLYTSLSSRQLLESNKAPHLVQFYLRINFNQFVNKQSAKSALLISKTRKDGAAASAQPQALMTA